MEKSIEIMTARISSILKDNEPSIHLFGSIVLDDFKLGWSDIDFVCLTKKAINNEQASKLVNLRQVLLEEYPEDKYFKLFEGIMMTLEAFLMNKSDTVVYWGTSGQRITNNGALCPFSKIQLLDNGRLLHGNDFCHLISYPTRDEIIEAIKQTYKTISKYGIESPGCGWFLDIARCLYTLRKNNVKQFSFKSASSVAEKCVEAFAFSARTRPFKGGIAIIAKTKAGEWAIEENICPDVSIMKKIIEIRKNPLKFRGDKGTRGWRKDINEWEKTLIPPMKRFLDVFEAELLII